MPVARILLLTHEFAPFRGGIAEVADGLATGAAAAGHEPVLVAPDYGEDQQAADRERPYAVQRFAGSTCSMVSIDKVARFTRLCHRAIRRTRPDLVHALDPPAQMALAMLSRVGLAGRFACTIHGTELLRYGREAFPRLWLGGGLGRARAVHAVSQHVRARLAPLGVEPARSFVVHPGIRSEWVSAPRADRAAARSRHGLEEGDFVLLTLSRRVPEKGHEDVIAALALEPDTTRSRVAYVVAGTGPADYARRLSARAEAAGVRIVLTGAVADDEAIALADAADLFIMVSRETPTRLEGFGIAYLEAAARGVPALARATGGAAEAVRHGETGLVLPAGAGIEAISAALPRLIDNPSMLRRMGDAARTVAREHTWQRQAAAVYREIFARSEQL